MREGEQTLLFTNEELAEIKKWAEVMGYQGTVKDLERALQLNRGIRDKCEGWLDGLTNDEGRRTNGYAEETEKVG